MDQLTNTNGKKSCTIDLNLPPPPNNPEAEKAVLGVVLMEGAVAGKVLKDLCDDWFYQENHRQIFCAMKALFERGDAIDTLTIAAELRARQTLDVAGGNHYLASLAECVPSAANVAYYIAIIRESARKRMQIGLLTEMLHERCNGSSDEEFQCLLEQLRESQATGRNNRLRPIPLSQLDDDGKISWRWQGYLADGHFTLLTALWKSGKTTLLAHLFKVFEVGGELAGKVAPTRILLITEESTKLWATRRDKLHLSDHIQIISRPFKGRPTRQQWEVFVFELSELIQSERFRLVVFDTIAKLWPVKDEKDATEVGTALMPLYQIVETGCSVLFVHHPRKGDGSEGQASRGSGELTAFVDVIIEMRRFAPANREDTRRVLTAYSRFDETQPEIVIELTDSGYRRIGTKAEARQPDRFMVIAQVLDRERPGKTAEEIWAAWPEEAIIPKPGKRTVELDLKQGVELDLWCAAGEGKRGDPYRYRLPDSIPAAI
ncbi:MAG: hypothetical protein DKINENOH_01695 [bacterium]|nr:hypothetical protein [bacterium]